MVAMLATVVGAQASALALTGAGKGAAHGLMNRLATSGTGHIRARIGGREFLAFTQGTERVVVGLHRGGEGCSVWRSAGTAGNPQPGDATVYKSPGRGRRKRFSDAWEAARWWVAQQGLAPPPAAASRISPGAYAARVRKVNARDAEPTGVPSGVYSVEIPRGTAIQLPGPALDEHFVTQHPLSAMFLSWLPGGWTGTIAEPTTDGNRTGLKITVPGRVELPEALLNWIGPRGIYD